MPLAEPGLIRGAESVQRAWVAPGNHPEDYAWINTVVYRNLYCISLS